jgi:hypothetical protein
VVLCIPVSLKNAVVQILTQNFFLFSAFLIPSKQMLGYGFEIGHDCFLPNLFQFDVHNRSFSRYCATTDIVCFSLSSFINFIANGERVGLVVKVCEIFETSEEYTARNEK